MSSNPAEFAPEFELTCTGWWEQAATGRQPMEPMCITLKGNQLRGAGYDMVGPFDLLGTLDDGGRVAIVKHYRHRHSVLYAGNWDGEGTMSGLWEIGFDHGRWLIQFGRSINSDDSAIQDIHPG